MSHVMQGESDVNVYADDHITLQDGEISPARWSLVSAYNARLGHAGVCQTSALIHQ
jgi:hypothetical protein